MSFKPFPGVSDETNEFLRREEASAKTLRCFLHPNLLCTGAECLAWSFGNVAALEWNGISLQGPELSRPGQFCSALPGNVPISY